MSGVAAAGLAVGMYGENQQANAAEKANRGQQAAGRMSLAELKRQFDIGQNNQAPWLRAGKKSLREMEALMGLGGDTAGSLAALQSSPGYQFRLQQGQRGLDAMRGGRGMGSGKAMTAAGQYNQNFASNEYGNRLNQLAGLSGTGQSTAVGMSNQGMNYAGGMGNIYQNMANAQGAAGIAGANARQSGVLGGAQLGLNLYDYMNRNRGNTSPYSGGGYNSLASLGLE